MQQTCFEGFIDEIPNILVDHFVHVKLASAFFLSHCHADHMKGLNSEALLSYLKSNCNILIYCSKITKEILSNWSNYAALSPYIRSLDINQNIKLTLENKETNTETSVTKLIVTLIPTGHCPGSVMFLFEGRFGTVLYSGDLRIAKSDCSKLKGLMNNPSRPDFGLKSIDHLYLDCTFCYSNARRFPTRDESVQEVIARIKEWTSKGPSHKVYFSVAGRGFGAEFVFVEIFRRLKMATHVSPFKCNIYKNIPDLNTAVSLDPKCRIHACEDNGNISVKKKLQCTTEEHKILTIRLTTQWHLIEGKNPDCKIIVEDGGILRTLFSMHSSLEELQDFVSCLRPEKITPIARPEGVTIKEISQLLGFPVLPPYDRIENPRKLAEVPESTSIKRLRIERHVEVKPSKFKIDMEVKFPAS